MIVRTSRSGGLLYQPASTASVDGSALPPDNRAELERLVSAANFGAGGSTNPAARDARQYRVTVEDGTKRQEATFDDLDPNSARHRLVDFVAAHGTPS